MFAYNLLRIIAAIVDLGIICTMVSLMWNGMKKDVADGALFGEMLLTIVLILNLIVIAGGKYAV